jgi:tRNA(His) 5'-end guanylyltransferase
MDLGDRMKAYEKVPDSKLAIKSPVILRVDGKKFHNFTRGLDKPFDFNLMGTMQEVAELLCQHIQGAKLAYTQSDEISILLTDWDSFETTPWLGNRVQKLCSITASLATAHFNNRWQHNIKRKKYGDYGIDEETKEWDGYKFLKRMAVFDCRCFNLPMHEVSNYFIWRQQDWIRNSIQMLARSKFSQNQLHKKNREQMNTMLVEEYGISWDRLDPVTKYGTITVGQDLGFEHEFFVFKDNRDFFQTVLSPDP